VVHSHEPATAKAIFATLFLSPLVITLLSRPHSTGQLLWMLIKNTVLYLLALSASITAYRLSPFHPLARYPGPLFARLSRFWALKVKSTGKQHL
jgi:formate hydrogenlyase subunit 4